MHAPAQFAFWDATDACYCDYEAVVLGVLMVLAGSHVLSVLRPASPSEPGF
jgi:hypothetical protein